MKKVNAYMNQNFKGKDILKYTTEHKKNIKKKFWDVYEEEAHGKLSAKLANEGTRRYMNKNPKFKRIKAHNIVFPTGTQGVTDMWMTQ